VRIVNYRRTQARSRRRLFWRTASNESFPLVVRLPSSPVCPQDNAQRSCSPKPPIHGAAYSLACQCVFVQWVTISASLPDRPDRNFVVSLAGKVYDARGEFRGLPPANCLFRLSSNRTRIVVPVLELFGTSVPRSDMALARISVLTPNHASICMDGKFTSAYSRRYFADIDCCRCD
jgi:hypothetical protein